LQKDLLRSEAEHKARQDRLSPRFADGRSVHQSMLHQGDGLEAVLFDAAGDNRVACNLGSGCSWKRAVRVP
jgi:hypothetical protein